jgi:cytidine deaminase
MNKDIIPTIQKLKANAYVPISNFRLGCCIETKSGELFYGVNWETNDLSEGCCAETSALCDMVTQKGYANIRNIWLMTDYEDDENVKNNYPCGICRQLLSEFSDNNTMLNLLSSSGRLVKTVSFNTIMPNPFNYKSYMGEFIENKNNEISISNSFCPDVKKYEICSLETNDEIIYGVSFSTASFKGSVNSVKSAISRMITYHGMKSVIKGKVDYSIGIKNIHYGISAQHQNLLEYINCSNLKINIIEDFQDDK